MNALKNQHIAILIDSLAGGGAEKVMITLALALKRLGHEPVLFILKPYSDYDIPKEFPVIFCFDTLNIDRFYSIKKNSILLKNKVHHYENETRKFDLFLSNLDTTNNLVSRCDFNPVYYIIHNSIEGELKRQLKLGPFSYFKMLFSKLRLNGKNIVCVSKGIEEEILAHKKIKPKTITTIYNPIDEKWIVEKANENNSDLPNVDYIIHVGRFAKQKRHDVLFKSLKLMKSDIPLVLLCKKTNKLLRLAKKIGVEDRLILPGFQKNPYPWIKKSKALVLCSDYEGLGMVLIESLLCNTPAISTNCPHGPSEILGSQNKNFLVPCNAPAQLAKQIDSILGNKNITLPFDILPKVEPEYCARQYLSLIQDLKS